MTAKANYINHHGILLKDYILSRNINSKGQLNNLIAALGVTRQNLYVMYKQEVIKQKYRDIIVKHLNLPDNFFPAPKEDVQADRIMELQQQLIQSKSEVIRLMKKLEQSQYSPKLFPVVVDSNNKDKIALVHQKAAAGYTKNFMDAKFIAKLPTYSFPNTKGGFAFEIEGESMTPSGILNKDYVVCDELVERIEYVKKGRPYIVVLNSGDIVCKMIEVKKERLNLVSSNKEFLPYFVSLGEVMQIWKVRGRYTPLLEGNG